MGKQKTPYFIEHAGVHTDQDGIPQQVTGRYYQFHDMQPVYEGWGNRVVKHYIESEVDTPTGWVSWEVDPETVKPIIDLPKIIKFILRLLVYKKHHKECQAIFQAGFKEGYDLERRINRYKERKEGLKNFN